MIKEKDLREFRDMVRYRDGQGITLQTVQDALQDCADKMGIQVAFKSDQVKSGGLLNSSVDDCIVMYHPQHENDYFKFCIRVRKQGLNAYVSVNDFGQSKQMAKAGRAESYQQDRQGKDLSYKIGSVIGQAITTIGSNKAKLEEEKMYYDCIFELFDEIVS